MKIVFVISSIAGGGAERAVVVFANGLAKAGVTVDIIVYRRHENEYAIDGRVGLYQLPIRKKEESSVAYYQRKAKALRSLFLRLNPSVIIAFLPTQVVQSFFFSRGLGIPFVSTVRNNFKRESKGLLLTTALQAVYCLSDAVWVQTKEQRMILGRMARRKSFVLPNPVDESMFDVKLPDNRLTAAIKYVSVGRLEKQKNHKLLIDAFSILRDKCPEATLDIYGAGSCENDLRQQIANLSLQHAVRLCGRTENVSDTLKNYNVFVLSSDYEGMPNSLMEAMSVGLRCVSTQCEFGPSELLANNRGLLAPCGDKVALAEAMFRITQPDYTGVNSADELSDFMKENYSTEVVVAQLIERCNIIISQN